MFTYKPCSLWRDTIACVTLPFNTLPFYSQDKIILQIVPNTNALQHLRTLIKTKERKKGLRQRHVPSSEDSSPFLEGRCRYTSLSWLKTVPASNSKHWFTTSFLHPLPELITTQVSENCQLTDSFSLVLKSQQQSTKAK